VGAGSRAPVALEGAPKLKELVYIYAEGFAGGELKHGPIALIAAGLPVIVVMPSPKSSTTPHAKLLSNIREIRARGAISIGLAEVSMLFLPLLFTIRLQILRGVARPGRRLRCRQTQHHCHTGRRR
jgi:glucosamine--fructose-6-phosphate aminotransferase (isomerizing)